MNVIRTFHPVGQGAFYSERFYEDGETKAAYNIVYDCGVAWGNKKKSEHVITQSFNNEDKIDYLFISHLDYDHISLVETLISCVRHVNNIVLPFMVKDDVVITMSLNKIAGYTGATVFLQRVIDSLNGNERGDNDTKITFVADPEQPDYYNRNNRRSNGDIWGSGEVKSSGFKPDWIFIPFNVYNYSRKNLFIKSLEKLLVEQSFVQELDEIGYSSSLSSADLYKLLKDTTFVEKVIKNRVLKNYFKRAYEKVEGGINVNSLLLYSGPDKVSDYRIMRSPFMIVSNYYYHPILRRAGCLYTGDSDFELSIWKSKCNLSDVWDNIGTIQLPHHGSVNNFDFSTVIDKQYIFPVSCGSNNSYGHPSGKVLAFLASNDCYPHIITETAETIYFQVILG